MQGKYNFSDRITYLARMLTLSLAMSSIIAALSYFVVYFSSELFTRHMILVRIVDNITLGGAIVIFVGFCFGFVGYLKSRKYVRSQLSKGLDHDRGDNVSKKERVIHRALILTGSISIIMAILVYQIFAV